MSKGAMAMVPPSCWSDRAVPVALDTSAVINLNATGHAPAILRALAREIIVVDEVAYDLSKGIATGRRDAEHLEQLVAAGLIRRAALGEPGKAFFEWLSIGAGDDTLDDGEAATIALAAELGCAAMVDESKGRRLQIPPPVGAACRQYRDIHPGGCPARAGRAPWRGAIRCPDGGAHARALGSSRVGP